MFGRIVGIFDILSVFGECPVGFPMSNDTAVFQSGEVGADRLGIYVDSVGDLLASKRLIVVRTEKTDDSPACRGLVESVCIVKAVDADGHMCD